LALEDFWLGEVRLPEVSEHPRVVRALLLVVAAKHQPTYMHLRQVSRLTESLAEWIDLPRSEVRLASYAGLLHDVGKVTIPDEILVKPSRLDDHEAEVMITHAAAGAEIVHRWWGNLELSNAVRHHHEWWDGKGYPGRLIGNDIPLLARMIGIADAFDTMTTPRHYRQAISVPNALAELERCSESQFDPHLTAAFVAMIRDAGGRGNAGVHLRVPQPGREREAVEPLATRVPR